MIVTNQGLFSTPLTLFVFSSPVLCSLALTGRMSGPDVGEQLRVLHLAQQGAASDQPVVPLASRIQSLKAYLTANKPVAA